MINIRAIGRSEMDDIESIIGEKNRGPLKTALVTVKAKIVARYSSYIELETNRRLSPILFSEDEKSALRSLYSSKTKTARKITKEVLECLNPNHSDRCLYCGVGEIDEIDHYLPQEHFPEFSILHKNLIPICGRCNLIKGDDIPGENAKDFLHMIYDILPLESFLACDIIYHNGSPKPIFDIRPNFSTTTIHIHFSGLNLKIRIEKSATQYFLQIRALKDQFGMPYALEEIKRDLNKARAFFGGFYWKTELLEKMIATDFLNKIT